MAIKLSETQNSSNQKKSPSAEKPNTKLKTVKPWQAIAEEKIIEPDLLETILEKRSSGKFKIRKIERKLKIKPLSVEKNSQENHVKDLIRKAALTWFDESNPD